MNINHLKIHKLVFLPVLSVSVVFLFFFCSYILFQDSESQKTITHEINMEIQNNSSYFAQEIYLGQTNAYKQRFNFFLKFLQTHINKGIACSILEIEDHKADYLSNCNYTMQKYNLITLKDILVGSKKVATIKVYFFHNPFQPNLVGSILISLIAALLVTFIAQIFLVRKIFKSVVEPFIQQLSEKQRLTAIAQTTQMLAHDVRKPFSLLRSGINTLKLAKNSDQIETMLSTIIPEVDRAMKSVDGLISDVMEIGSTSNQLFLEPVSPESLIEMTLREIFQVYPKSKINLSYDLNHTNMINVHVQKVSRVFSNIIINSLQAMEYKGSIWFKTRNIAGNMEFCIGNSGCCIPKENLSKLFETFFTSGKKGGTGLGLAIAQKIVEVHGGKIWCESSKTTEYQDGKVEIFFTLPISDSNPNKTTARLPTHSSEIINSIIDFSNTDNTNLINFTDNNELEFKICEASSKLGRPINILIVDDEIVYIVGLTELLSKIPAVYINISRADNSEKALLLVDKVSFDIIITDIDMGTESLNGFELVQELKNTKQVESLICIHSNHLITVDHKYYLNNVDAFIPKPIIKEQLLKLILRATEKLIYNNDTKTSVSLVSLCDDSDIIISVIDDEEEVLNKWRFVLGSKNVFYFTHPDDFIIKFTDDCNVRKTNLIITDYYFSNIPIFKLLDIKMLRSILKFSGKIFLFSNVQNVEIQSSIFDYIFPEKINYFNKSQLRGILKLLKENNLP